MVNQSIPKVIAHRGASGIAPENTLSSVEAAIALHVDYVEIDVRLTKDNVPVVIHDASLHRTTGLKNSPHIHELSLEQVKRLDVGAWYEEKFAGERIPTLAELLRLSWDRTGLMIEIKKCHQPEKTVVDAVFDILCSIQSPLPELKIGSFSPVIVAEVQRHLKKKTYPILPIGIIEKQEMLNAFIELEIKHLAIWYKLITPSLMSMLKDQGIVVWTFTVNDVKTARFLSALGIDGLISNHPGLMKSLH